MCFVRTQNRDFVRDSRAGLNDGQVEAKGQELFLESCPVKNTEVSVLK